MLLFKFACKQALQSNIKCYTYCKLKSKMLSTKVSQKTSLPNIPIIMDNIWSNSNHKFKEEIKDTKAVPIDMFPLNVENPCIAFSDKNFKSLLINDIFIGKDYYIENKDRILNTNNYNLIMDPKLNNIYESLKLSNIVIQQSDIDNNVLKISDNYKKQNSYTIKQIPQIYLKLSKSRLTSMVVMTEMCGYLMAPGAFDSKIFVAAMLGTFLTSASANTINQFLEIPYDSQMNRTKNRVLVSGIISPPHAICFALVAALLGLATFFLWVNPISGLLAAFNLALYTAFYTRSKRTTILNTWIGAVVGAVPPLIGYFARYRIPELSALTNMTSEQIGACVQDVSIALLLASLLYTWQFPHFNALSWNLKHEYCRAGYRMMSAANPALCLKTAFLHSLYAFVIVTALLTLISFRFTPDSTIDRNLRSVKDFFSYIFNSISKSGANVISARVYADDNNLKLVKDERKNRAFFNPWTYFVIAGSFLIPLSLYNIHLSRKFYFAADSKTSRKLFRYSLIYLPFTLGVLLVYKTSISSQKNIDFKTD